MDVKEFTEKMKEKGYEVEHKYLGNDPLSDALVVSKDNRYFVPIHPPTAVFDTPIDYLLEYVEREITRLKEGKVSHY